MPNMFGGSSTHPAYMPRRLTSRETLIGNTLYTILGNGRKMRVEIESVSGSCWSVSAREPSLPMAVRTKVRALGRKWEEKKRRGRS